MLIFVSSIDLLASKLASLNKLLDQRRQSTPPKWSGGRSERDTLPWHLDGASRAELLDRSRFSTGLSPLGQPGQVVLTGAAPSHTFEYVEDVEDVAGGEDGRRRIGYVT